MSATSHPPEVTRLVSYRRCVERIRCAWPAFLERRAGGRHAMRDEQSSS
ncbi:hypothetical protein [Thermogemmatispora carboxidivorans]|nr:hypothetical protein [Thermogemmatispora carboxidivorans]